MKRAIWGWYPPQYEKYLNGKYAIYYNPQEFQETHTNPETKEETTITRYNVYYEDLDIPELTQALDKGNELEANKILLKKRIELYDNSPFINQFTINGVEMWLDKATRTGLLLRFSSEKASGIETTTLWFNGQEFTLNVDEAIQMLYAIERYASKCYDCTQQHLANAETTEDPVNYDYRANYPTKLEL